MLLLLWPLATQWPQGLGLIAAITANPGSNMYKCGAIHLICKALLPHCSEQFQAVAVPQLCGGMAVLTKVTSCLVLVLLRYGPGWKKQLDCVPCQPGGWMHPWVPHDAQPTGWIIQHPEGAAIGLKRRMALPNQAGLVWYCTTAWHEIAESLPLCRCAPPPGRP